MACAGALSVSRGDLVPAEAHRPERYKLGQRSSRDSKLRRVLCKNGVRVFRCIAVALECVRVIRSG